MSMVNSPKTKYRAAGAQEQIPPRVYVMRIATYALLGLSVLLFGLVWFGGDIVNRALGRTGIVQGIVVGQDGQPIANSEISLLYAPQVRAQTDQKGAFTLNGVPVGTQSLIVSVGKWGQEYPVTVQRSSITDAGTLTYLTPPTGEHASSQ